MKRGKYTGARRFLASISFGSCQRSRGHTAFVLPHGRRCRSRLVLDLPGGVRWLVEVKRSTAPRPERGFYSACEDLKPAAAFVVYPGAERFPLKSAWRPSASRPSLPGIAGLRRQGALKSPESWPTGTNRRGLPPRSQEEHFEALYSCTQSDLAQVSRTAERPGLPAPTEAQKSIQEAQRCIADFFYAPNGVVSCDGKPHDQPDQPRLEQRLREKLQMRG